MCDAQVPSVAISGTRQSRAIPRIALRLPFAALPQRTYDARLCSRLPAGTRRGERRILAVPFSR
jgi:hypothetical protein